MKTSFASGALLALTLLVAPRAAHADDVPPDKPLFDRGRRLMQDATTLDEGCRVLGDAFRMAARGDTLLNLAECHRRQGKTFTAWDEFNRAIREGEKINFTEAMETAKRLRDALALKLSRVVIEVPPQTSVLEELVIEVNGKPWPKKDWNNPVILDPGPLVIRARAKAYKPFAADVQLGAERDVKTISVVLEAEPPPPPPPPPAPPPPPPAARPVWPWIVGGLGLVLGAAAIGFEVDSRSAGSTLNTDCTAGPMRGCPPGFDFSSLRGREVRGFDLFVGLGLAGIVGVGAGAIGLGVTGPKANGQTTGLVLGPNHVGIVTSF